MAVCQLRTIFLIVCVLELVFTIEKQVFDFLGFMWLPIVANFMNILLIIFGCFGAVQYITKYLLAYAVWSLMWLSWNGFLICYFLNLGTLNRESDLLSMGTGSVSWWEGNGWGCQPMFGEVDGPGSWRPARVDGCLLPWPQVELGQAVLGALLAAIALPMSAILAFRSIKRSAVAEKENVTRRPIYTIELSPAETAVCESTLKPMTPRRVKRRSGSRGNNSSVRRSRRSYRNAGYLASTASLPRDPRPPRPASAHSSYSNYHGARPASYHATDRNHEPFEPQTTESVPTLQAGYDTIRHGTVSPGYDVAGPYEGPSRGYQKSYDTVSRYDVAPNYEQRQDLPPPDNISYTSYGATGGNYVNAGYPHGDMGTWEAPPPPAPPYCARATPQAPGPPAYQPQEGYNMGP